MKRKFSTERKGGLKLEWVGFLSLALILCYASYPEKTKKLERRVNKLERIQGKGENMSKLIEELVNQECKILTEDALKLSGNAEIHCKVLDVDDEWIKISFVDKKNNAKVRILKIEDIESIELLDAKRF